MNTSHHPTTGSRGRAKALLLALLGGLALLLVSPYLASQQGMHSSGGGANSDGGDNPVVGSLPCAVDPELDLKFVQAPGSPGVSLPVPTLGYVGPDLGDGILNLEFHTKMNSLDDDIIKMYNRALDLLDGNDWQGLGVGNEGEHFSAGANLMMIVMIFRKELMVYTHHSLF